MTNFCQACGGAISLHFSTLPGCRCVNPPPIKINRQIKREWVGLTEDECIGLLPVMPYEYEFNVEALLEYTKNVEAKLKERNT